MRIIGSCTRIVAAACLGVLGYSTGTAGAGQETLEMPGLVETVEILRDPWGVSHIYAQNQHDLFFAQGFNVARDRLFQLEMWRRRATGTTAELVGPAGLKRDIATRLLQHRVDMKKELRHYHEDGEEIISAFVEGINAYIDLTRKKPELLPIQFGLLGTTPQHWTTAVVVSRHNGLSRNVTTEVSLAQAVNILGGDAVESYLDLHPGKPQLEAKEGLDLSIIDNDVLELYRAHRRPIRFQSEHIVDAGKRAARDEGMAVAFGEIEADATEVRETIGSNNWVVAGDKTATGMPIMANDPHRGQQVPSLRYWVHLVAPGWNVIGGGEPALPGVSIGHNEFGAWGLTIFAIDQEDLLVYKTNPANRNEYWYKGRWEAMEVVRDTIAVKGRQPVEVELKYTRNGPVIHEDPENHLAYALRAVWLEAGTAPYLASLRFNQARNWKEFLDACSYHRTPSENMIWADREGNIGWQAVGMTPIREGWNGLLPVPGDGRFEWQGFLPILKLPHVLNPAKGFFASANEDNVPAAYGHKLGYMWSAPFRSLRLHEVLENGRKFTLTDMMALQVDEISLPARALTPLLRELASEDADAQQAIDMLWDWDHRLDKNSVKAAIYTEWQRQLVAGMKDLYVPEAARGKLSNPSLTNVIRWLTTPDQHFGANPTAGRDAFVVIALETAVRVLRERFGGVTSEWSYGQPKGHHITLRHQLSSAVDAGVRARLDLGPLPRGGDSTTVNNTSNGANQRSGASFKIIVDTSDWDNSLGANNPGQSGDPDSPHYSDLFQMWADGKYFPIFYTRERVESVAESTLTLTPASR